MPRRPISYRVGATPDPGLTTFVAIFGSTFPTWRNRSRHSSLQNHPRVGDGLGAITAEQQGQHRACLQERNHRRPCVVAAWPYGVAGKFARGACADNATSRATEEASVVPAVARRSEQPRRQLSHNRSVRRPQSATLRRQRRWFRSAQRTRVDAVLVPGRVGGGRGWAQCQVAA
jgi:hypothetical protein